MTGLFHPKSSKIRPIDFCMVLVGVQLWALEFFIRGSSFIFYSIQISFRERSQAPNIEETFLAEKKNCCKRTSIEACITS